VAWDQTDRQHPASAGTLFRKSTSSKGFHRGVHYRGIATVLPDSGTTEGGLSGDIIRITPQRIIAWGLDGEGTTARDVDAATTH